MEIQSIRPDEYARVGSLPLSESVKGTPLSLNTRDIQPFGKLEILEPSQTTVQSSSIRLGSLGENYVESPQRVYKNRIPCIIDGCDKHFRRDADRVRHEKEQHGPTILCEYIDCAWIGTKRIRRYHAHLKKKHGVNAEIELIIPPGFSPNAIFTDNSASFLTDSRIPKSPSPLSPTRPEPSASTSGQAGHINRFNTSTTGDSMSENNSTTSKSSSLLAETEIEVNEESSSDDWHLIPSEGLLLHPGQMQPMTSALSGILAQSRRELVQRLMAQFWIIFKQMYNGGANQRTPASSGQSATEPAPLPSKGSDGNSRKRNRVIDDSQESDEDKMNDRSRLNKVPRLKGMKHLEQFACPYRKHNPQVYNVNAWRSCSLVPLESVSRVKEHLYLRHEVHQCERCQNSFECQEELSLHLTRIQGCELNPKMRVDGITGSLKARLRCRKKTHTGQSQADRWRRMYGLIFETENIPSPYFDPVVEDSSNPGLEGYAEYTRRELPRVVQEVLEREVDSQVSQIEEKLRAQLGDIIQQCLDTLLTTYRTNVATGLGIQREPHQIEIDGRVELSTILESSELAMTNDKKVSSSWDSNLRDFDISFDHPTGNLQSNNASMTNFQTLILPTELSAHSSGLVADFDSSGELPALYPEYQSFLEMDKFWQADNVNSLQTGTPVAQDDPLSWTGFPDLDHGKDFDFDAYLRSDPNASI